jgi:hypothetical protein
LLLFHRVLDWKAGVFVKVFELTESVSLNLSIPDLLLLAYLLRVNV